MFEFITSFLADALPGPPPGPIVTVLIIPADGTAPSIKHLPTTNVRNDGNVDRHLHYVPDMRAYWGTGTGWEYRDKVRIDITNHAVSALNGVYYGFKSFDLDSLPLSKHTWGIYGDACIVKMAPERYSTSGVIIIKRNDGDTYDFNNELSRFAVYDDITMDVVHTGLWKELVEKLPGL